MEVSCEELEKVLVESDSERFFQIGSELPPQEKSTLIDFFDRMRTYSPGIPMRPPGLTQISYAITSMLTRL